MGLLSRLVDYHPDEDDVANIDNDRKLRKTEEKLGWTKAALDSTRELLEFERSQKKDKEKS